MTLCLRAYRQKWSDIRDLLVSGVSGIFAPAVYRYPLMGIPRLITGQISAPFLYRAYTKRKLIVTELTC